MSLKRSPLISESMRRLLPPFPFVPTKPRTGCIPIAAANAEQVRRNNTPPFDFDLNLPALPDQEHQQEQNLFGLCWHQIDQFVIMAAPPPLLLMDVPSSQSQSLLPIKKRKTPSQTPEPETKMINKKTRTIKKLRDIGPILTMPAAIRERIEAMGGHDIVLVIQKILTDTDLNKNHGRLSLPPHQLREEYFLTEEEDALLENNEEDKKKKKGMTVRVFDGEFKESSMRFKKWKIGSRQTFCLMTEWNSFVRDACLKANDEVQIWSFRVNQNEDEARHNDSNLCFIVIKILKREN